MFPLHTWTDDLRSARRLLSIVLTLAFALSLALSGTVAAKQLEQEFTDTQGLVSPSPALQLIDFKLRTTDGYRILVFGE